MRFIANGPAIPSQLLTARDAGQVLFFCGAGLSRAAAGLPDFIDLAGQVIDVLGSTSRSDARRLHAAAKAARDDVHSQGGPDIDRVFSQLEREFEIGDIRRAVAQSLKPQREPNLAYHRALLALSQVRSGEVRLVTTNFDQLFEACDDTLRSWAPPHLPDPAFAGSFQGVVHLHGSVDAAYTEVIGDALVVSTAEFGHSYLADGWATRFIQSLMRRFTIVFVGYSAGDPPVQYLLEAVTRFDAPTNPIFAFHAGDEEQANAQWLHRGVTPIAYDPADGHAALWDTLMAWAERARDPVGWTESVLRRAQSGPEALLPHERGMVCDVVSSSDGARALTTVLPLIPASWLRVFDARERCARPSHAPNKDALKAIWMLTRLDDEPWPGDEPVDYQVNHAFRPLVWDAFTLTEQDVRESTGSSRAIVLEPEDVSRTRVPPRVQSLRNWMAGVSHQPAMLWWAAGQKRLDRGLTGQISGVMTSYPARYTPALQRQWRWLFNAWEQPERPSDLAVFELIRRAEQGWTSELIRSAGAAFTPQIVARRAVRLPGISFAEVADDAPATIVSLGVDYGVPHRHPVIPDERLGEWVPRIRRLLEDGLRLERDLDLPEARPLYNLVEPGDPLITTGLPALLPLICAWMARWSVIDPPAAQRELGYWASHDGTVFTRLRTWAASVASLCDADAVADWALTMGDAAFWEPRHEPDLLCMLASRWAELEVRHRSRIEHRMLHGAIPVLEQHPNASMVTAWNRLYRWHDLARRGVRYTQNPTGELSSLQRKAPHFTAPDASNDGQVSGIAKRFTEDLDSSSLQSMALSDIVDSLTEDEELDFSRMVHRRPFLGLVQCRPARALRALGAATKRGIFHAGAWRTVMSPQSSIRWTPRSIQWAARRIAQLQTSDLASILREATAWLDGAAVVLQARDPEAFTRVWNSMLVAAPKALATAWRSDGSRDWMTESLNSPVHGLLSAVVRVVQLESNEEALPPWARQRFDALMALPGDLHRYAVCLLARHCSEFFMSDPDATTAALLGFAQRPQDRGPFFDGFLSGRVIPIPALLERLMPEFLKLAVERSLAMEEERLLVELLLHAWHGIDYDGRTTHLLSDARLRDVLAIGGDRMRSSTLWLIGRWADADPAVQGNQWRDALKPFFAEVWPRQRLARTVRTTGALVRFAMEQPTRFAEVVSMVLPYLVALPDVALHWYLDGSESELAKAHPAAMLQLLCAVLPMYSRHWPYGIEPIIRTLADAPETANDRRLTDLIRRLHQA